MQMFEERKISWVGEIVSKERQQFQKASYILRSSSAASRESCVSFEGLALEIVWKERS